MTSPCPTYLFVFDVYAATQPSLFTPLQLVYAQAEAWIQLGLREGPLLSPLI